SGLTTDFAGLLRPSPPSIGAYEFSSASPTQNQSQLTLSVTPNSLAILQPVTLTASVAAVGSAVPTGSVAFYAAGGMLGSASLNSTGIASYTTSSLAAGVYAVTATYTGDNNYSSAASIATSLTVSLPVTTPPPATGPSGNPPSGASPPPPSVTPPPTTSPPSSKVSVSIAQPDFGFNVIPASTRRIFASVANGTTNQVVWTVKSGSAQISSTSGSWIDVTAPATGSSCSYTGTGTQPRVSSSAQFTIEATSVDDGTKSADVTFNVCNPVVEVSVVPFYRTLYANQPADVQTLVLGSVNENVHWKITSQPANGDGRLTDSTSRDTLFTGTTPGRYHLTATSVADPRVSATAIMYVTGNKMPYRVTPNLTEPVDCTVDPSMLGTVYEVGPSQTFKTLASVPFSTIAPGSTVRLHNEDKTGLHPTEYHEYVQISQAATADQPFRLCGIPDTLGNLPIIDGANATGRSDVSADVVGQGLLTLHDANYFTYWPKFSAAQYIVVEGIQFRNAKTGYSYTTPAGSSGSWQDSSACIRVNQAQNVAFVGDDIGSCSSGVLSEFNSNGGWGASDVNLLWEGNYIHDNGIAGSKTGHQMYLQSWGNVVQFNRIDKYTAGALGSNIKSRGLQDIIRYNYLGDGAQREMDLVDVTDAPAYMSFAGFLGGGANSFHSLYSKDSYPADRIAAEQEAWNSHFVYGNIYQNSTSAAPIHFSMDTSGGELARKGSLYWYNNTFYQKACSTCSSLWTLFDTSAGSGTYLPQTEFQTVQAYNNIVWMDNPAKPVFQWNNDSAFIGMGG
ncbi:MAG: Ig-like domain-containing protein, partial [Edaphobacter sp.]